MKKKLLFLGCLAVALTFNSCSDDDDNPLEDVVQGDPSEEEGESGGEESQADETLLKKIACLGTTTDEMRQFIAKMPAGKYNFEDRVLVKTSDNAVFLLNPSGLQSESNVVGGTIWNPNWIVGPEMTGYMYYNDMRSDETFAPCLHAYQYTKRDSLWQNAVIKDFITEGDVAFNNVYGYLSKFAVAKDVIENHDKKMLRSEPASVNGMKCTHYYFLYEGNVSMHLYDLWLTDEGFLINWGTMNQMSLDYQFEKIDDLPFDKIFSKLMGEYNVYGAFEMSSCIQSIRRYENKIPTSRIPKEAAHYVHFEGDVDYYDISYNPWKTLNGFVGVTFKSQNVTHEEAVAYIEKVKKSLNLCTVNEDSVSDEYIIYEASDWDCTDVELSGAARYPLYKIIYMESLHYFKVEYTEDLVMGV